MSAIAALGECASFGRKRTRCLSPRGRGNLSRRPHPTGRSTSMCRKRKRSLRRSDIVFLAAVLTATGAHKELCERRGRAFVKVTTTFVVLWSVIVLAGCDRSRDGSKAESTRNDETYRYRSTSKPLLTEGPELRKQLAGFLKMERRTHIWILSQAIPGSKVEKRCAVQFDVQSNGYAGPEWRPLFAIVWKAEDLPPTWFNPRPPSGKSGIYAPQPDYSLRQIPLTAEETVRLFSRLIDWE